MTGQIPPILYSADFISCKAIPHLTEQELADIFGLVLQSAGATIVHAHCHAHGPSAITCAVILTESHAVLHTWKDSAAVNVDIFCCSSRLKAREAIENLRWLLGAKDVSLQEILRAAGPE